MTASAWGAAAASFPWNAAVPHLHPRAAHLSVDGESPARLRHSTVRAPVRIGRRAHRGNAATERSRADGHSKRERTPLRPSADVAMGSVDTREAGSDAGWTSRSRLCSVPAPGVVGRRSFSIALRDHEHRRQHRLAAFPRILRADQRPRVPSWRSGAVFQRAARVAARRALSLTALSASQPGSRISRRCASARSPRP